MFPCLPTEIWNLHKSHYIKLHFSITNESFSLLWCLNVVAGGPSNTLPPLSWAARLKIAQGAARGLMHIHECSPRKYVHGNIKSSKILLDDHLQPYVSGFGLTRLVSGASSKKQNSHQVSTNSVLGSKASANSIAYLAPEARVSGTRFTQKCDVYSFGIVLMEVLTARLPDAGPENDGKGLESLVRKVFRDERPLSEIIDPALLHEVYAKKQVLSAFHVALNCTELDPELRPRMRTVSESLDRIKSQWKRKKKRENHVKLSVFFGESNVEAGFFVLLVILWIFWEVFGCMFWWCMYWKEITSRFPINFSCV